MAIPKTIYQTYSSWEEVPPIARFHIWNMRRMNPAYEYVFYDDEGIIRFLTEAYEPEVYQLYSKLTIGAAKADFFRYAVLLKNGGVYVDIDSRVTGKLDKWVLPSDVAVITKEKNPGMYVQWALIFDKEHSFLKKTMEKVLDNIRTNRFPNSVHKTTGPSVFSEAIRECIEEDPDLPHRVYGCDYEGKINAKYWLSRFTFRNKEHWKLAQKTKQVVKE